MYVHIIIITITLYPTVIYNRATITLYPIGRPVRATITLYPKYPELKYITALFRQSFERLSMGILSGTDTICDQICEKGLIYAIININLKH